MSGLGKGLSALISEKNIAAQPVSAAPQSTVAEESVMAVGQASTQDAKVTKTQTESVTKQAEEPGLFYADIGDVCSGRYQPRMEFKQEELQELSESIKVNGVVQPILVRAVEDRDVPYELIAGERRLRASKLAGLTTIPAVLMEITDKKAMEVGLIENIQRQDLNILEEAAGYKRLLQEFSYTQEELSEVIGKSRSAISNTLRLLTLPDNVQQFVREDKLSAGHARSLLQLDEDVELAASEIIRKNLSVRQTEDWVKKIAVTGFNRPSVRIVPKSEEIKQLEKDVSDKLGLKVSIAVTEGKGTVKISYDTMSQLNALFDRMGV